MEVPLKKSMLGLDSILNAEDSEDDSSSILESGSPSQLGTGEGASSPNTPPAIDPTASVQHESIISAPHYEPAPENNIQTLSSNRARVNIPVAIDQVVRLIQADRSRVIHVLNRESTVALGEQLVTGFVAQSALTSDLPTSTGPYRSNHASIFQERTSLPLESHYYRLSNQDSEIVGSEHHEDI